MLINFAADARFVGDSHPSCYYYYYYYYYYEVKMSKVKRQYHEVDHHA